MCKTLELIRKEWLNDLKIQDVIKRLQEDPISVLNYSRDSIDLRYKGRIVLASNSSCQSIILNEFHSSLVVGHSRFLLMYKRICQLFY